MHTLKENICFIEKVDKIKTAELLPLKVYLITSSTLSADNNRQYIHEREMLAEREEKLKKYVQIVILQVFMPAFHFSYSDVTSYNTLRSDFTSKLVHVLAFGTPKFYIAPYDKIKHELVNLSSNCDVKSGLNMHLQYFMNILTKAFSCSSLYLRI